MVQLRAPPMVTLPCPPDCRPAAQPQISLRLQRQMGMTAWAASATCLQTTQRPMPQLRRSLTMMATGSRALSGATPMVTS